MGHSQYDDAGRQRSAWNAGKKVGTKRPLSTPPAKATLRDDGTVAMLRC